MEVRIDRGRGEVAVETEIFILLFWLVREFINNPLGTITINVPLFKKLRGDNLRGQKSLGPLKMSLEMAHKVIVPQKKIRSQSFLNSVTLVILCI
jgi:hypothetical protein